MTVVLCAAQDEALAGDTSCIYVCICVCAAATGLLVTDYRIISFRATFVIIHHGKKIESSASN